MIGVEVFFFYTPSPRCAGCSPLAGGEFFGCDPAGSGMCGGRFPRVRVARPGLLLFKPCGLGAAGVWCPFRVWMSGAGWSQGGVLGWCILAFQAGGVEDGGQLL